jgi:hypothetical protein
MYNTNLMHGLQINYNACTCMKSSDLILILIFGVLMPLSTVFQLYHGDHFSGGGSTRKEPLTRGKQPVNFITCGCKSSAPVAVQIPKTKSDAEHKCSSFN